MANELLGHAQRVPRDATGFVARDSDDGLLFKNDPAWGSTTNRGIPCLGGGTLHVHFDPDFDAGAVLGEVDAASFGRAVVGPRGFADLLDTALGLGGLDTTPLERWGATIQALRATSGFWSASVNVDPLGSAQRLLQWRDLLVESGWRGQSAGDRLDALWTSTQAVPGGFVDRLVRIESTIQARKAGIARVQLHCATDDLPDIWQRILKRLQSAGTVLVEAQALTARAPAGTNLGKLQAAVVQGRQTSVVGGDASLKLIRAFGPMLAAEDVAAHLTAAGPNRSCAIVAPDAVLDDALYRFGLPTCGVGGLGRAGVHSNALTQVLPLLCELAFAPIDPQRALELLSLPESPIPVALRWRLVRALDNEPAVGSASWSNAVKEGTQELASETVRKRVTKVLERVFCVGGDRLAGAHTKALQDRASLVRTWAAGRTRRGADEDIDREWGAVVRQCESFSQGLVHLDIARVPLSQARQLLRLATAEAGSPPLYVGQAGVSCVGQAGGIAGPVDTVIWWNFSSEQRARDLSVPLTTQERSHLATAGVQVPDAGHRARRRAARERRALVNARQSLLLICPQRGSDGEAQHPHPLWDEISARAGDGVDAARRFLVGPTPPEATAMASSTREMVPLPSPTTTFSVSPSLLTRRTQESPSSVGTLLGCPFKHTVHYVGGVRRGKALEVGVDARVLGTVSHAMLAELADAGAFLADAREQAAEMFDKEIDQRVAALGFVSRENERLRLRSVLIEAAADVAALMQADDLAVYAAEQAIDGVLDGLPIGGKPDLVLRATDGRLIVIDFKWGGGQYRRDDLADGTSHQLAAYAKLLEQQAPPPSAKGHAIAYYILTEQRLLTNDGDVSGQAEVLSGPAVDDVWNATALSANEELQKLGTGVVAACGVEAEGARPPKKTKVIDNRLVVRPPCSFCDFSMLCGRAFAEGVRP